ncbi:MAG TPA: protein kinase, partial [Aggregatilineaceae bacterium]|nr:protein kinase [Aggregatilineaceae bacterium]
TGTGGFIGTAAYASPEQCRGEELTPVSDVYSLGVVLYEMLTGVLPYQGPTPLAIMHRHISEPVPNPLKDRSDLPLGITEVMRKALAKLPQVRYQTALAMSGALNEALRPVLGTKPLAEKAPPRGPNPVFTGSSGAGPLPIPDELLRNFAPTRPTPPSSRDDLTGQLADRRSPEPLPDALAPATSLPRRSENDLLVIALLVVTVLIAAAIVAAAFVLH